MPTKRHEELRGFAHRILGYMGINKVQDEHNIYIKSDGKQKQYRIDVVGWRESYDEPKDIVLIEIGNNNYDKINNLRLAGYLLIVIPYSEKEEEWQDEVRLIKIMIEGNKDMEERFHKVVSRWTEIGNTQINKIEQNNVDFRGWERDIEQMSGKLELLKQAFKIFKGNVDRIEID